MSLITYGAYTPCWRLFVDVYCLFSTRWYVLFVFWSCWISKWYKMHRRLRSNASDYRRSFFPSQTSLVGKCLLLVSTTSECVIFALLPRWGIRQVNVEGAPLHHVVMPVITHGVFTLCCCPMFTAAGFGAAPGKKKKNKGIFLCTCLLRLNFSWLIFSFLLLLAPGWKKIFFIFIYLFIWICEEVYLYALAEWMAGHFWVTSVSRINQIHSFNFFLSYFTIYSYLLLPVLFLCLFHYVSSCNASIFCAAFPFPPLPPSFLLPPDLVSHISFFFLLSFLFPLKCIAPRSRLSFHPSVVVVVSYSRQVT